MLEDEVVIVNSQDAGEGKWSQHPELLRKVVFVKSDEANVFYVAVAGNSIWKVALNDFPDEPLHKIMIDNKPIRSFNNRPDEIWIIEE